MASSLVTPIVAPHAGALATRIGAAPILLAGAVATAASTLVFLDTLAGVRDGQQGLASGLVGSSFQIGGAIVLATATAAMLAHTPAHATAVQNVHGLAAGVYVTVAAAGLLVLLALVGLFADRRRVNALELVTLDRAA